MGTDKRSERGGRCWLKIRFWFGMKYCSVLASPLEVVLGDGGENEPTFQQFFSPHFDLA